MFSFFKKKYIFNPQKYNLRFFTDLKEDCDLAATSKVIYCFWTGGNDLTVNRKTSLDILKKYSGVEIQLITPLNLEDYILEDYPLHEAYQYLSLVHRSDYLRCYFMYHYGGGYTDIKANYNNWKNAFDLLNDNHDKAVIGYPEIKKEDIGYIKSFVDKKNAKKINKDMKKNYYLMIGNCSYIFKPKSLFAKLWYDELHLRLDENLHLLKKHPGNVLGDNEGYPLPWTSILGQIFHPLCLNFHDKLILDENLRPILTDYR